MKEGIVTKTVSFWNQSRQSLRIFVL